MNDSPVDCQNTSVTEPQREDRAIAVGGVGGVLGIGEIEKRFLQRHPGLTHLSRKRAKWRRNAFGLNDRILQAKTHSPRQPRFARSLQSASGVGASPAGKEPKQKPRGDCLEAFVLAPPVGLEPTTP